MEPEKPEIIDYDHPVAYDVNGQPLYAHPASSTQTVHMARPIDPDAPVISDATKIKHEQSKKLFPGLNLSDGEYVISAVRRHPIGLAAPFLTGIILITIAFSLLFNFDIIATMMNLTGAAASASIIMIPVLLFVAIVVAGTYAAYYIFTNNKFYLTNESIIQEVQVGLFTRREQTISLANVEDASFAKSGIIQQLLDYGTIRLSTIGDETTYGFTYVASPKEQIDTLNNAVEAFKNGRPVERA